MSTPSASPPSGPARGPDPSLLRARRLMSRRTFLEALAATGAMAAGAGMVVNERRSAAGDGADPGSLLSGAPPGDGGGEVPTGRLVPAAVAGRVLVVVDLQGGNDGLSTLVPFGSGIYHDLRPQMAVPDDEVLALDDEVGLHPSLRRLSQRGLITVEGVGPWAGNLSHFDMAARWQRGDVDGSDLQARTGFLGRLVDALDDGSPLVGLTMGAPAPHLTSLQAATMALASVDELWFLEPGDWADASIYQHWLPLLGGDAPYAAEAVASYRQLLGLAAALADDGSDDDDDDEVDWEQPMLAEGGDLGWQLHLAADVIAAGVGTRVIYTGAGDYDTHSGHVYRQAENLSQLDAAVDGFMGRAEELGFADRVLVATISEFGRRVHENGSGLDHGNSSTMLVAGPVGDIRAGERPPLDDLDDGDNLRTMIGFDRYLATLAQEWLGVEAASVLAGEPEPLGLLA